MHSHRKGIAGDGFVAAYWESHTVQPFKPSLTIGGSYAMGRSVSAKMVSPTLWWWTLSCI